MDVYRKSQGFEDPRRIALTKVDWYLDDHVKIELTPCEVNVKYSGQEPSCISQIRQELAGTDFELEIKANL